MRKSAVFNKRAGRIDFVTAFFDKPKEQVDTNFFRFITNHGKRLGVGAQGH